MVPRSIHVAADGTLSSSWPSSIRCTHEPRHLYPVASQWTFGLSPCLGYREECCCGHWGACVCFCFGYVLRSGVSGSHGSFIFNFLRKCNTFPQWLSFTKYFCRLSFHLLDGFLCCAYNRLLFILKKEINPAVCDNMDEPGGHHAQ